jgi:nicotinamidase-related amidase
MSTGKRPSADRFTELHPLSLALITMDVQNDIVNPDGALAIREGSAVVPRLAELVRAARAGQRPIFHIVRLYLPDGSNAELCRRTAIAGGERLCIPGSDGAELVASLKPEGAPGLDGTHLLRGEAQQLGPQEWAVYKPRWSAFFGTPLVTLLRERGIDSLLIAGYSFPRCVLSTIWGASENDFRIGLVIDATSEVSEPEVADLRGIGVQMVTSAQAVGLLAQR